MIIWILILPLSALSAIMGRAGGEGHGVNDKPTWIPMWLRQRFVRPLGCSVCALLPLFIIHPSLWFILAMGLLYGALSLYWDELFGFDNMWFSGFMCGIAGFALVTLFPWWLILIRAFVLAILWGGINLICNHNNWSDGTEEMSRYGILALTTMIML